MILREKLQSLRAELREQFIERDREVDGTLTAVLSRQHLLLIGPPGAAKSLLAQEICGRITGAHYFGWLLTRFTTPEELFGPISLRALEEDRYYRLTAGKLPGANIAFLDEVFKANSAILNALLAIMNERVYHNEGEAAPIPLTSLFGASNEVPQEAELAAFYDRFLLRYQVSYVAEDGHFLSLLKRQFSPAARRTCLTLTELTQLQEIVAKVAVTDDILHMITHLRRLLQREGIHASDRRYANSLQLLKAHAALNGRDDVAGEDLSILQFVLWSKPEEMRTVSRIILSLSNPLENQANELLEMAIEIHQGAIASRDSAVGVEANVKLRKILSQLEILLDQAGHGSKLGLRVKRDLSRIEEFNRQVLKDCLGLE